MANQDKYTGEDYYTTIPLLEYDLGYLVDRYREWTHLDMLPMLKDWTDEGMRPQGHVADLVCRVRGCLAGKGITELPVFEKYRGNFRTGDTIQLEYVKIEYDPRNLLLLEVAPDELNNFHGYMPGGHYRKDVKWLFDKTTRERYERIIADVDKILAELQFDSEEYRELGEKKNEATQRVFELGKNATPKERKQMLKDFPPYKQIRRVMALPVYTKMRRLGYSHMELTA